VSAAAWEHADAICLASSGQIRCGVDEPHPVTRQHLVIQLELLGAILGVGGAGIAVRNDLRLLRHLGRRDDIEENLVVRVEEVLHTTNARGPVFARGLQFYQISTAILVQVGHLEQLLAPTYNHRVRPGRACLRDHTQQRVVELSFPADRQFEHWRELANRARNPPLVCPSEHRVE
jgi:hypothetical protein